MRMRWALMLLGMIGIACVVEDSAGRAQEGRKAASHAPARLRFEILLPKSMASSPQEGRLFVVMSTRSTGEPRFSIGRTGLNTPPVLAKDVNRFAPGRQASLDESAILFPLAQLGDLPTGEYTVQAVFAINKDLRSLDSAGNYFSKPIRLHLDPNQAKPVSLELTQQVGPEKLPPDTETVKYVKIQSERLTRFWGRPIYLRAGVILPRDFAADPSRQYPLWVRIGGFGTRYTRVGSLMRQGSDFRKMWLAEDTPHFLILQLDGDGPYGDPYQVNSANNGPYGDAITRELIPYIERTFRGIGQPYARVLDGGSTGGWVSLALQVFYPDFFNGTWSVSPDPVDFRAYELINIYEDKNAYINRHGFERASERETGGDTIFTMRHECQMENMLGAGDSYTTSGGQWCAWNAAFGRRGPDGRPIPLWNPRTGEIDRQEAEYWKKYDLRLILEANWKTLAPKLAGKIHLWVGDADNYFLNNAVHLLDAFLSKADPPYGGRIQYGPGKGHTWTDLTDRQMLGEMQTAVEKERPH
jgi:hypothetical protein